MHLPKCADQKAYCCRQASECAAAASATSVAEVRQAYLDLQQAWLSLAPSGDDYPAILSKSVRSGRVLHCGTNKGLRGRSG